MLLRAAKAEGWAGEQPEMQADPLRSTTDLHLGREAEMARAYLCMLARRTVRAQLPEQMQPFAFQTEPMMALIERGVFVRVKAILVAHLYSSG